MVSASAFDGVGDVDTGADGWWSLEAALLRAGGLAGGGFAAGRVGAAALAEGSGRRTRPRLRSRRSVPEGAGVGRAAMAWGGGLGSDVEVSPSAVRRGTRRRRVRCSGWVGGLARASTAFEDLPNAAAMGSASVRMTRRRTRLPPGPVSLSWVGAAGTGGGAQPRSPVADAGEGVGFGVGRCSPFAKPDIGAAAAGGLDVRGRRIGERCTTCVSTSSRCHTFCDLGRLGATARGARCLGGFRLGDGAGRKASMPSRRRSPWMASTVTPHCFANTPSGILPNSSATLSRPGWPVDATSNPATRTADRASPRRIRRGLVPNRRAVSRIEPPPWIRRTISGQAGVRVMAAPSSSSARAPSS